MEKIIEVLLKFGVTPVMSYFDQSRGADSSYDILQAGSMPGSDKKVNGILVRCGGGDIFAVGFTNPKAAFLETILSKFGIGSGYRWMITDKTRWYIYVRVNYHANQFGRDDFKATKLISKQTTMFDSATVHHRTNCPFAPLGLNGKTYEFVNGEIDENTTPFEIHVDKLITVLSEYTDIEQHVVRSEQAEREEADAVEIEHVETSLLPYRIYAKLPKTIKSYVDQFNLPRESDISLLALLVVISCCLPNVVSRHRGKKIWAYLYLVITAGAASGKGVLSDAIRVVEKIEAFYRDIFNAALKIYKSEYRRYKKGDIDEEPVKPILKTIQLPTDNSFIALFEQLFDNGGAGLLYETEIDVFINAGNQEWGNYSTLNRKATHHETHTLDRKSLEVPLTVPSPRLGMVMSGTPNQFFNLFKSIEDGLYSRFLVYCYQLKKVNLMNPYNNDNSDYFDTTIEDTSDFVFTMYQSLVDLKHEIEFRWTESQGKALFNHFTRMLETSNPIYGEGTASIVLRHMLMATRLGMVLAAVEAYEQGSLHKSNVITAGDHIADIVTGIMDTCSQHSLLMMTNIKANAKARPFDMKSMKMLKFYDALPDGKPFKTKEAIAIAITLGISPRSVGDYIPALCKSKHLAQVSTGVYRRTK